MGTLNLAALVLTVSGVGDATLLDFGADYCAPCRSMEPIVAQLSSAGYPVRRINIEQDRALAAQYHVSSIPCFVMVVDGREVDRLVGATDAGHLQAMFQKAGYTPGSAGGGSGSGERRMAKGPNIADQKPQLGNQLPPSNSPTMIPVSRRPFGTNADGVADRAATTPTPPASRPNATPGQFPSSLFASVRLKIEDSHGSSFGSGTIIDAADGEALILTCGHVFRESSGQGKILVDTFGPRAQTALPGKLVHYDLKSDVGLIAVRTKEPVSVAKLAPPGYQTRKGDKVFTVGCNHGADPTVRETVVTALDKFLGPPNVQIAGQPVQGRSGGGLFNNEGLVIGVCNAADPTDDEGLYAALASVHAELDRTNLAFIYRSANGPANNLIAAVAPPEMPKGMPSKFAGPPADKAPPVASSDRVPHGAIYLIRPNADPSGKNEVIVLDSASEKFWKQLEAEQKAQAARQGSR